MAYRLAETESTREGLRRCAREELESAIRDLTERVGDDPVEAVHDARKSLKKDRALLRAARGSIRASEGRRENATLRDAGRRLSLARDADVMIEALEKIGERYAGQFPRTAVDAVRSRLEHDREVARLELMASGAPATVAEDLRGTLQRVDGWHLRKGGWRALGPGLRRTYRDGRRAYRAARKEPTVTSLHEWRKRAKDLWYHLKLLEETAPHTMQAHATDAHLLSELLGDDHDLAVLRDMVLARSGEVAADTGAVLAAIEHRQGQLREDAFFLGQRIYAESPKAFTVRMRRYWKGWRAQTRATNARVPADLAEATRVTTAPGEPPDPAATAMHAEAAHAASAS
jgi:CHAD domain-containing protein